MDNYAKTSKNIIMTDSFPIAQAYPDNTLTENVAVLFTDIVGSTEYFKTHGDKLGREMLRSHHNIASSIVSAYGGKVIKLIGDSIMASFAVPAEAFKAAIKMQQKFKVADNDKYSPGNIGVRVGIHYGRVIVENNDIYGDVVNVASKLTNLAYGGQIFISGDIYNLVKNIPHVHFELVPNWHIKNIPYRIEAYKVSWDEKVELAPTNNITVYICPINELADEDFKTIWNGFDFTENAFIMKNAKRKIRLPDTSFMIFFNDVGAAVKTSSYIMGLLADKLIEKSKDAFLPIQIVIETFPCLSEDDIIAKGYCFSRESFKPGTINISEDTYHTMDDLERTAFTRINIKINNKHFYRWSHRNNVEQDEIEIFLYGNTLIQGSFAPCFYCGSKKHISMDCPSKKLPDVTHALDRLGYLSFDSINELFLNSLVSDTSSSDAEKSNILPFYSFYELTREYQLRFLRAIWGATGDDWNTVANRLSEKEGGFVWLAQDSLRISNHPMAESLIKKAFEHQANDFRVYCVLGFMCIEKNDYDNAINHFNEALAHTAPPIHKIYLQLLLARIHKMNNRSEEASKIIGNIISKNPSCSDAVYLDIIIKFQQNKVNTAITQLVKLVESNRKYFMCAYIDPELKPYSNFIMPELTKLFNNVKKDASDALNKAENELSMNSKIAEKQLSEDIQSLFLKAKNAYDTESYYGYFDALYYSKLVISRCDDFLKEKKKALLKSIGALKDRISYNIDYLNKYKLQRFASSYRDQLFKTSEKIDKVFQNKAAITQINFDKYSQLHDNIYVEIENLEERIKNTYQLEQSIRLFFKLSRLGLIFLSIVFLMGFFILPQILYYLKSLPLMGLTPFSNIALFQKLFYFGGVIISVCILLVIGIKEFNKTD